MALRVAVAGATGDLGVPIVKALLAAGYHVTALTREGSNNTSKLPKSSNLSIAQVNYSSAQSLENALKGHTVVISTLTSTSVGDQNPLIDAAIAAGVARFIPSEFGSDVLNEKRNQLPVFEGKVKTHEYLKAAAANHPGFTYTVICTGAFLDWGLHGFVVNVPERTAIIYNGGDVPFSATSLDTIGRAVVGVIEHLPETANRPLYIHDAVVTQNQLIRYAKEKDGREWKVTHKSTEEMRLSSLEQVAKGNTDWSVLQNFVFSSFLGEGYGIDFSDHLDNELLGIKGLTEAEVRELVESLL
ncbi:NAD(P)-binding protein [Trichoderma citrinoviride]|uniref:NAD(P)-binding protein n=1 Tax=Trichoderma citrinoviride TaxID=58853 RepID=A0A2T4B974_9HYPO|nr:NAD(P)-binding protein [Trichoderma citrinoviride]PTB65875.1 NAD(P)-binding protein [Trichoderma citrinoviride]